MANSSVTTPTFSVIIPSYNRANFIKQTIESVLAQTFEAFEVIVVDDGSTDNTGEIVAAISDPRVSYHFKMNEERAVARNTGAKLSQGKYLNFLDSDDLLYPEHLATALEVAHLHDQPELFHLGYEIKDASTGSSLRRDDLAPTANDRLPYGNCFSCNGVFLRRDVAMKHPFNSDRNLSGTEDYELWLRLASRYPLYCDNRVTSVIVQHDDRSVVTTDRRKLETRIELLEKYLFEDDKFLKRYSKKAAVFKANNRVYIALHLALAGRNKLGAMEYLLRALYCSVGAFKNRAFYGTLKRLVV